MELMVMTERVVVPEPVMVSKPLMVIEAVTAEAVMRVATEWVTAMTMDTAMHTAAAPTVEAATTTTRVGQCCPAEQQGEHEPEGGEKWYSECSAQHGKSIQTRI